MGWKALPFLFQREAYPLPKTSAAEWHVYRSGMAPMLSLAPVGCNGCYAVEERLLSCGHWYVPSPG